MGKKYLDTKQNTIEASVLDVWTKSSEEQEAIRNAAEMFVKEKYDQAAIDAKTDAEMRAKGYTYRRGAARVYGGSKRDPRVPPGATPIIPVNRSGMPKRSKVGKVLGALGRLSREEFEIFLDELMLQEKQERLVKGSKDQPYGKGTPRSGPTHSGFGTYKQAQDAARGGSARAAELGIGGPTVRTVGEHPPGSKVIPRGKAARDRFIKQQKGKLGKGGEPLSALAGKEKTISSRPKSKIGRALKAIKGFLSKEEYETFIDELMLDEGWFKDLVDKKRTGAKAAGSKKPDPGHAGPKDKPEKPKPSITSAIKDIYGRLFNGDFIGMTAYLNTLNEDQSSDQIAVIIGDINETALTLINPENLDQTMSINLDNLQIDINEDGELEFYEAVDPKTIPVWNPRKGGGRTGQKPPLK